MKLITVIREISSLDTEVTSNSETLIGGDVTKEEESLLRLAFESLIRRIQYELAQYELAQYQYKLAQKEENGKSENPIFSSSSPWLITIANCHINPHAPECKGSTRSTMAILGETKLVSEVTRIEIAKSVGLFLEQKIVTGELGNVKETHEYVVNLAFEPSEILATFLLSGR